MPLSSAPPGPMAPPALRAEARRGAGPEAAGPSTLRRRPRIRLRFFRELLAALVDPKTYDLKANPALGVGFLMALPIPFITWASAPPTWLLLLSLPAPFFWGLVVAAAGRVGIRAVEQAEHLETEIAHTRTLALATREIFEEALDEEVQRREELEQRERAVQSELRLAEIVHRTLIPKNIQRDDVEVAIRHIPTLHVGGDYLLATVVDDRYLYLAVGDVSGHGVAAALVVARLHALFRRLTLEQHASPVAILEEVNQATLRIFEHTYFFMTLAVCRLDLATGRLRYATAGHPSQALLRADGRLELLRTPNRLLGIDGDIFDDQRPSDVAQLEPGDAIVLFTDGLYEILDGEDDQVLGEQGLHERIASLRGLTPALMAGEILQELADFQGRSTFADDVSLMVAGWRGPPLEAAGSSGAGD